MNIFFPSQSDKLQEQQELIAELQCHLSTPAFLGLGLNLRSRPHTAPMGSLQHSKNGGLYRQVSSQQSSWINGLHVNVVCQSLFILDLRVCMWFQVSAVSQLGNGRCGDQDGGLYDGEIPGGAEIHETEQKCYSKVAFSTHVKTRYCMITSQDFTTH